MRLVTGIFLAVWASLAQTADLSVRVQRAPADGMLVFQVYDSPNAFGRAKFTISEGESTTIDIEIYKVLGERGRLGVGAGVASFIELTEDWRIVLSLSAEFLPDEIVSSPIVTDDRIMKDFAAITYVF